jgi:hypothetical protein
MATVATHTSFLEDLAREECRLLNCKEHPPPADGTAAADAGNMEVDEEERLGEERRRLFLLVDFSSHDDDDDNMSESDYFSSDDEEGDISDEDLHEEEDEGGDAVEVIDVDALSDDDDDSHIDDANEQLMEDDDHSSNDEMEIANTETTNTQQEYTMLPMIPNDIYQRIGSLLFSLSNSEEVPLIRADIPWSIISSCDAPLLTTLYKRSLDPGGTMLLQGMLRMDPPLDAVKKILDAFPLSCVDMEGFFTACQFAQPRTSRQLRPLALDFNSDGKVDAPDSSDDDVGEVVRLIMHKTILARRSNNIGWSMVAFLGELLQPSLFTRG